MRELTYSQRILRGGPLVRWQRFARFRVAAKLMRRLGANHSQRLLDIGAADGIGLPYFEPIFKEVVCMNYYEDHSRELQQAYPGRTALTADARSIPLADSSVSFVVSLETLHCIPDRRLDAIKEIHRVLEPGGHFIFSVPIEVGYTAVIKYLSRAMTGHALAAGMGPSMLVKHVFPRWSNVTQYDTGRQVGFDAYAFQRSIEPWFDVLTTRVLPLKAIFPFNLMVAARKRNAA